MRFQGGRSGAERRRNAVDGTGRLQGHCRGSRCPARGPCAHAQYAYSQ
ncbi:hypothetical protein SXIM_41890 [Streptomyces xiamenensis]|uniref:Uncharacterized protein n=1 Tax=Streptomyces xiamenensis TaxID=408015 RepID=A0A0F7FYC2_9ACTN|nr:hypothetical protein SXIM_41890 [Streptomyces xiamenensis]